MSAQTGATIRELTELVDRMCERYRSDWDREKSVLAEISTEIRRMQESTDRQLRVVQGLNEVESDPLPNQIDELESVGPCEAIRYRDGYGPDNFTDYECGDSAPLIRCSDGEYRCICEKHEKEWR